MVEWLWSLGRIMVANPSGICMEKGVLPMENKEIIWSLQVVETDAGSSQFGEVCAS